MDTDIESAARQRLLGDGLGRGIPTKAMTEKQLAAIERARHEPAVIVEIRRERERNLSFTAQELIEFVQGNWADRERERLVRTWGA